MSSVIFPNGQTLTSSALSPTAIETVFQPLVANILGIPTDPPNQSPSTNTNPYSAVRIGWQTGGQPAWGINEDVCILTAKSVDAPYSRVRDQLYADQDVGVTLDQQMSFTQVWNMHFTLYGPNSYDHAREIVSAMWLDWVHDTLAALNIYAIVEWHRPQNAPENFQGQWWSRTDIDLQFNELVLESLIVPAAASLEVTLIKENGLQTTIDIPPAG